MRDWGRDLRGLLVAAKREQNHASVRNHKPAHEIGPIFFPPACSRGIGIWDD